MSSNVGQNITNDNGKLSKFIFADQQIDQSALFE